MTNRYEILDILSQDGSGVCFYANDRETGKEVVLRRFFPFGPDGGGLQDEERAAYEISVKRLQNVSHPALRSVLNGGTDPVDGMPFLVTEWIEGSMLSDRLHDGPLSPESVRAIADLALDTSLILSEAFGEEAVWVETDPSVVILSDTDPARQVTFWISPLRWLGDPSARSDLNPLLEMVEDLSGWRGQMISRSSGGGLGAWVKTLRDDPNTWTLGQAKAALHEPATIVEAAAAQAAAAPPPAQQVVFVNRPVVWPWVLAGLLALGAAGIVGWRHLNPDPIPGPIVAPPPVTPVSPPESVPAVAESDKAPAPPAIPKSVADPAPPPASLPQTTAPATPETPSKPETQLEAMNRRAAEMAAQAEANALMTLGEKATLEGTITGIESSKSGKSYYFQFKTDKGDQLIWAMFRVTDWEDFDLDTIEDLNGKHARFTGRWNPESSRRKVVLRMSATRQLELLD